MEDTKETIDTSATAFIKKEKASEPKAMGMTYGGSDVSAGVDPSSYLDASEIIDACNGYYTPLEVEYGYVDASPRAAANMQTEEVIEVPGKNTFPKPEVRETFESLMKKAASYAVGSVDAADNQALHQIGSNMGTSKTVYIPDPSADASSLLEW